MQGSEFIQGIDEYGHSLRKPINSLFYGLARCLFVQRRYLLEYSEGPELRTHQENGSAIHVGNVGVVLDRVPRFDN
jgi:hypothetical protein